MSANIEPKLSKAPAFHETPMNSPITQVALALRGHRQGAYLCSGTGVVIGANLAITAAHVLDDLSAQLDGVSPRPGLVQTQFDLQAAQMLPEAAGMHVWNITRCWISRSTDIAVLGLVPTTQEAREHRWLTPKIRISPPNIGERVAGFGYAGGSISRGERGAMWTVNSHTAVGEVQEIHYLARDANRLPFPCYRVNARFDGGMSGGPVFNDAGELCGLVCSNLPPVAEGEEHVSYVTSLWPLMQLEIDVNRVGHPKGVTYPVADLARDGFILVEDLSRVELKRDECGKVVSSIWHAD